MIDLNWWFWQTFKSRATQYSLSISGWTLDFMRTPDTADTCLHAATRGTAGGGLACTFRNMRGVLNYQLSSIFRMVHTRYKLCVHVTPLFDCFLSYNIQLRACPAYSRVMHHCRKVAASPAPASTDTTLAKCIICSFILFSIFLLLPSRCDLTSSIRSVNSTLRSDVVDTAVSPFRLGVAESSSATQLYLVPAPPPHAAQYWRANSASIPHPPALASGHSRCQQCLWQFPKDSEKELQGSFLTTGRSLRTDKNANFRWANMF